MACDPHGNLCKEYVDGTTVIRSYRESPHTDLADTVKTCCRYLVDLLEHRRNIRPAYRKLPLILGGEQSVSADEPVRSINQYMDEMEKDPRILSASWHVGYIRHDTDVAGCGVVVVPNSEADQDYAEQKVDELAAYVWERRHEFHYTGLTQEPEEAIQSALNCPASRCSSPTPVTTPPAALWVPIHGCCGRSWRCRIPRARTSCSAASPTRL